MATQHDFYQVIERLHQAGVKNLVRLMPRAKEPHVLGGRKVTTDSPSVAESWFRGKDPVRLPNLGVLAGKNNLIFIDIDASGKKITPEAVLKTLNTQTAYASTPRGGIHLWFSTTKQQNPTALRLNLTKILNHIDGFDKIDIKQGDAYVVIPPSDTPTGNYSWHQPPWDIPPASLNPEWCSTKDLPTAVVPETGQEPTPEEYRTLLARVRSQLPTRAADLISGTVRTADRSNQAFELGHLLYEAGIHSEREIAVLVHGSGIHKRKFARRRDAWIDACRIALRVLEAHTFQTAKAKPGTGPGPAEPVEYDVLSFAEIESEFRDPKFLIYPLLPRGEITLLDGDDGIGKSFVWIALTAGLTGSKKFPVPYDHTAKKDAKVLILTAEDDPRVTLGPRLRDLGANLGLVSMISPRGTEYVNGITAGELENARNTIADLKPDLIVVDHITIFEMSVNGLDSANAGQVRKMLNSLKSLAKEINCAVLVIRHFRKGQGSAKDRGIGSIAYRATARSHIVIGFDPEDTTRARRIITQVKMNLVPKLDEGIAYTITPEDGFLWAGTCEINPDALTDSTVAARLADGASKREIAREYLLEVLSSGEEIPAEEITAPSSDISRRTLQRAAKELGVISKRDGFGGKVVWVLPKNKRK